MKSETAFALLARENPVAEDVLPRADDPTALLLLERILAEEPGPPRPELPRSKRVPRRHRGLVRVSVSAALTAAVAVAALLLVGSPGHGPAVEDASAAVRQAAATTSAAAERSGTAVVRITRNDELWAEKTIRWNGDDLAVSDGEPVMFDEIPGRSGAGSETLLVDGTMYGIDPEDGGWVSLGSPDSIDPDSGTTPAELLAAVRRDVSGVTLARLTEAMTGLATRELDDGSTVYSGSVAAGVVARESGFKEGQSIRVLPFGYVAHGEADDPAAVIHAAVTVGADGVVREVTATWGGGASWAYEAAYRDLGATPAPGAPPDARPLRDRLRPGEYGGSRGGAR
jgi:hypothetical protein